MKIVEEIKMKYKDALELGTIIYNLSRENKYLILNRYVIEEVIYCKDGLKYKTISNLGWKSYFNHKDLDKSFFLDLKHLIPTIEKELK